MPISPEQTTFRRLQTDAPASVTIFLSIDGTLADGSPAEGPWQGITVDLTEAEQTMALALVARARQILCDRVNGVTP